MIREISKALLPSWNAKRWRSQGNASLASGSAGLAVFHSYLARCLNENIETGSRFLDHAIEAISATPMGASLYGGFTGIAWSVAHLGDCFLETDDNATESVDELLREHLSRKPWRGDYDLISGLVGFGVYALERMPSSLAIDCLEQVVERLDELAQHTAEGVTWFTPPEVLPDWQRKLCPHGYYNLGLAHGVPGVIGFLGEVCAANGRGLGKKLTLLHSKARRLLNGAVNWLLGQKLPHKAASIFPSWTGPGVPREPSRVAWCYGDLGIAAALTVAGRCVKNTSWEREALELARNIAAGPPEQAGLRDCGLCHGTAGVGHIFNRFFQATGDRRLRDAAKFWFKRTLEMRHPNHGIAGFPAFRLDQNGKEYWASEPGILEGAAGVALALLAAATDVEPAWDRMMLLSIPKEIGS